MWYKSRFQIPFIGITGSVGKTSTKEMIAAALSAKYNVLKTAGNQNSNIGVPLTLFRLEKCHEIGVVEMGISDFGEMSELADFVHPKRPLLQTSVWLIWDSLKQGKILWRKKLQIARHFDKNNVLYVNSDNDLLKTIADGSCDDLRLLF